MTESGNESVEAGSLADLEKEAKAKPNDLGLQKRWGWALYANNNYASAKAVFEGALTRWPESIEVNYALGVTCRQLGEDGVARRSFEAALKGSPSDVRSTMLMRMAEVQLSTMN
jgi:Flp pilus assembly protein TadD